ncbi:MAG: hypothetical protein VB071_15460 [Lawsonibacter sp.]|nr:hypothetical protein [Lawsonibacter sp.]
MKKLIKRLFVLQLAKNVGQQHAGNSIRSARKKYSVPHEGAMDKKA